MNETVRQHERTATTSLLLKNKNDTTMTGIVPADALALGIGAFFGKNKVKNEICQTNYKASCVWKLNNAALTNPIATTFHPAIISSSSFILFPPC